MTCMALWTPHYSFDCTPLIPTLHYADILLKYHHPPLFPQITFITQDGCPGALHLPHPTNSNPEASWILPPFSPLWETPQLTPTLPHPPHRPSPLSLMGGYPLQPLIQPPVRPSLTFQLIPCATTTTYPLDFNLTSHAPLNYGAPRFPGGPP